MMELNRLRLSLLIVCACACLLPTKEAAARQELNAVDQKRAEKWVAQLANEVYSQRALAQKGLTLMGPLVKPVILEACNSPDSEVSNQAKRILENLNLAEKLRVWGEGEPAFWSAVWGVSLKNPERLSLILQAAFPEEKIRTGIKNKKKEAAGVLKKLISTFSEFFKSDEEERRFDQLKNSVQKAGAPLFPLLEGILLYNMEKAFGNPITSAPFKKGVIDRPVTARDQVKAIYAISWLGLKEGIPLLARHLKNPSMTASSNALGGLQLLTGKKLTKEKGIFYSEQARSDALQWWQKHRDNYLNIRKAAR